ncbi:MAG: 4-diphosphocytidyl-2C-methyl-D-erythritol kinase [Pseudomonadota bacterium]|nr:4-diphosphocytidyl-2C-methyl-D-erythritol kinase [Pseudomonadota bacterium]
MNQGLYANHQGGMLESTVKSVLSARGFEIVAHRDYRKLPQAYGDELLLTNMPYDTIYGHQGKTEFLLVSKRYNLKTRIECKWQQVNGSVDEKLPYLYLNCIETMPEDQVIIVIDGKGWKKGAISWLKTAVAEKKYMSPPNRDKVIEVFSLADFITWANNTFR